MTTITLVRRGRQVAIASDALVTFGDTRLSIGYEANQKVFKLGDTFFGMSVRPRTFRCCARRCCNWTRPT